MTSINFNASANSSIRALQSVNRELGATQNRIATGFKINSAADNASVWKAASGLRSDIKSYDAAKSSMDFAQGVYEASAASADAVVDILTELKSVITLGASATGTAATEADAKVTALQARLNAVISDAGVGGVNLLKGGTMPTYITAFSSNGAATTAAGPTTVDFTADTAGQVGDVDATKYGASSSILNTTITLMKGVTGGVGIGLAALQTTIDTVTDYAASLGNAAKGIEASQDLMSKLADIKKSALSKMVDTDFETESAKLAALQVKQQLSTQALSIANSSSQNVLRLFQ